MFQIGAIAVSSLVSWVAGRFGSVSSNAQGNTVATFSFGKFFVLAIGIMALLLGAAKVKNAFKGK